MAVIPCVVVLLAALTAPFLVSEASLGHRNKDFITAFDEAYVSALGDPGMRSDRVRVLVEGWNFCNRAGNLSIPVMAANRTNGAVSSVSGSPRWADCTDLVCPGTNSSGELNQPSSTHSTRDLR